MSRSAGTRRMPMLLTAAAAVVLSLTAAPYAVVAGTVFRDDGRVLSGAQVTVRPAPEGQPPPKTKPLTGVTDQRGEFAFRVPTTPMRYTVSVKAKGFRPQEKSAEINADERVDLFFRLEPEKP